MLIFNDKIMILVFNFFQKLQRVGSGVLKFARKTKRDLPLKTSPASTVHVHVSFYISFMTGVYYNSNI